MIIKGQKINDRYEIVRTIGEGGMANVYLAFDLILKRNVAVKILRGDLASDEKFVRRFQREAISASSLSHSNIVEVYDVGEEDGKYYIVMEYIDGKTLKNLIKKRGALTVPEVIDIMIQLVSAISCAHENYIIHRDIKPQNVMILEDGRVKMTDFGIALAVNSTELTQTNSVMGSVHYLPPEQANGSGATVKSDIYSLGILMYELLTGKIPFKGDNAVEIAIKQMKEQIPDVSEVIPNIPQSIENIIIRACAKNPKNRYDTITEMLADIETCMNPEREEERKYVYVHPEHEIDNTPAKAEENLSRLSKKGAKEEMDVSFIDDMDGHQSDPKEKKKSKLNKAVWIAAILCTLVIVGVVVATVFYINKQTLKDVVIPDVSGMSEDQAIKALTGAGLIINPIYEEISDEDVREGRVVKTKPSASKTVKEKQEIIIYISTGIVRIKIEDYKDKDFDVIKALLEKDGLVVKSTKKDVDDNANLKENQIISQDIAPGTELKNGETITFTIPNIQNTYPDFVGEGYTVENVRKFCERYGCNLKVDEIETADHKPGTVYFQSREASSVVKPSALLTIKVAKAPTVVEDE